MLSTIIRTRRSVFPAQYTGKAITKEDLRTILESARWAPNHRKTQPWRYKVLQGGALKKLGDFLASRYQQIEGFKKFKLAKLRDNPIKASAIILIFMHRDDKESVPEWEELAATAMSVQNMCLTVHDLGYGAYWSSPKAFAPMNEFPLIEVHEREHFLGFLFLGTYEKEEQELPERMTIDDFTQFVE